jgi:hypothetical protein
VNFHTVSGILKSLQKNANLSGDYLNLAYQVGRACAVAGYSDLYRELDILSEVHIAEEAREAGSLGICEDIMSKPMRYAVVNDYSRTISAIPGLRACLYEDTAIYESLDTKQAFHSQTKKMNLSTCSSLENT